MYTIIIEPIDEMSKKIFKDALIPAEKVYV